MADGDKIRLVVGPTPFELQMAMIERLDFISRLLAVQAGIESPVFSFPPQAEIKDSACGPAR